MTKTCRNKKASSKSNWPFIKPSTHVKNAVDSKTGIPLISIYGKNKKPSAKVLSDVDIIIFDIQDVSNKIPHTKITVRNTSKVYHNK